MQTAYDPGRIHQLSMRTAMAIDALSMLSSNDPAAADALRAVRLLRRNLEDLWMPLLREIEMSQALISWTTSAALSAMEYVSNGRDAIVDWIDRHRHDLAEQLRAMTDDELLVKLAHIGEDGLPFDGYNGLDLDDPTWTAMFPTVAAEMAFRVRVDPTFRSRLVEVAYDNPVVGLATSYADFPTSFVHEVVLSMLHRTSRMDDFETRAEAAAASTALEALVDHPQVCLTTLQDPKLLAELAGWTMLDQDVVARFVQSGLHTAVVDDPQRLVDGYGVIGELTRLANDSLDGGFTTGMSRGLARSMIGYVDTLGRSIDTEDGGQVRVTVIGGNSAADAGATGGFTLELGTYEDVRNLFGAVARDVEAQAALGVVLGAYMNTVMADVGSALAARSGVDHVAQFADLLGDAVTAEQAEMIATAASATAQNGTLVGAIGFATSSALSAAGTGPLVGYIAGRVVRSVSEQIAEVEPQQMPNGRLRHVAYDAILVATVTLARTDPEVRRTHGLDDDASSLRQVDAHLARLAELDAAGDAEAYRDEVSDMVDFIEQRLPKLDAFVTEVRSIPAVNELVEGHP